MLTPYPSIPIQAIRSTPYTAYILHAVQLLLLINMAITLAPIFRRPDACEDIPLTPQQRHALGLPPMSRPATPQEEAQYVTPPRYSRSATPRSSFGSAGSFADSMRVQARASPLSGRGSPNLDSSITLPFGSARRGSSSGSPFSASPLKDKIFNTSELGRRGSFGSSRGSLMGGDFDQMNSPGAKSGRASVGLNSKWLYQKGRNSPGMVGNSWGTGSVFN
jgi:nucleoporin POM34